MVIWALVIGGTPSLVRFLPVFPRPCPDLLNIAAGVSGGGVGGGPIRDKVTGSPQSGVR